MGELAYAILFVTHFVADFLMQSREMGKKKSSEPVWLFKHLIIQWFMFTLSIWFFGFFITEMRTLNMILLFPILNTIVHGIIDWNVWRLYKYSVAYRMLKDPDNVAFNSPMAHDMAHDALLHGDGKRFVELAAPSFQYYEDHWFYSTIGFDQLLHILTILALGALCL